MKNSLKLIALNHAIAALAVAAALGMTIVIFPIIKPVAAPLFLGAIMVSAWRGGTGPGLVATILAGVAIDYFFVPPIHELTLSWDDASRFFVFTLEGLVISWLIATRRAASDEISQSRERLRALSVHLQSVREEELARVAREIHDELGQVLTGLKYDVYWIREQLTRAREESATAAVVEKTQSMLKNIDSTILSVRRIMTELRPAVLDDLGLAAAIEWQARDFQERTGIQCNLISNVEELDLDSETLTSVFRIFQESLTNIARHAGASMVSIGLQSDGETLSLEMEDDGRGIKDEEIATKQSFGIMGMRERARLLNGKLDISSARAKGTTVSLQIPLARAGNGAARSENGAEAL